MTPDRCQKILPNSRLMDLPNSMEQWGYALRRAQNFFLRGQWKQCASYCTKILNTCQSEPTALHATYLSFYAAMSTEALGRAMHPLSPARLDVLRTTRSLYDRASYTLPSLGVISSDSMTPSESGASDMDFYDGTDETDLSSMEHHDPPDSSRSCCSASSLGSDFNYIDKTKFPKPPSLVDTIQKGASNVFVTSEQAIVSSKRWQFEENQGDEMFGIDRQHPRRQDSLAHANSWLQRRNIYLYNEDLADFRNLLQKHLTSIDSLIVSTSEMQAARYVPKRIYRYGDDEEARAIDLQERVRRLKAGGWSRERFDPSRYEQLCEDALVEL